MEAAGAAIATVTAQVIGYHCFSGESGQGSGISGKCADLGSGSCFLYENNGRFMGFRLQSRT